MGEGGQDPGFFRKGFKLHRPKCAHVLLQSERQSGCACLQKRVGELPGTCLALGCSSFVSPRNLSPWQWLRNRHRRRQTSEEHLELISWLVWAQGSSEWPSTVWNLRLYTLGQTPSLSVISDLCFPLPCLPTSLPHPGLSPDPGWSRSKPDLALTMELGTLNLCTGGMGVILCFNPKLFLQWVGTRALGFNSRSVFWPMFEHHLKPGLVISFFSVLTVGERYQSHQRQSKEARDWLPHHTADS